MITIDFFSTQGVALDSYVSALQAAEDMEDTGGMTKAEVRGWAKEHNQTYANSGSENDLPSMWDTPDPSLPIEGK
jgi:hypothetical protein